MAAGGHDVYRSDLLGLGGAIRDRDRAAEARRSDDGHDIAHRHDETYR